MQNAECKMQNLKCEMQNSKREMRNGYIYPLLEVIKVRMDDIITSSPGTETPSIEETDGVWDLDL